MAGTIAWMLAIIAAIITFVTITENAIGFFLGILLGGLAMFISDAIIRRKIVQELGEMKKKLDIADSFYSDPEGHRLTTRYLSVLHEERKKENPEGQNGDLDALDDDAKAILAKLVINTKVENIIHAAFTDKDLRYAGKWKTANGFTKSASALIMRTYRNKLEAGYLYKIAIHVLVHKYKMSMMSAKHMIGEEMKAL